MNEFALIERLTRGLPTNPWVRVGAGDDCAVLDLGLPREFVLFKTDAVVEGIHFTAAASPQQIGHKALGRCLSDIAAMAGRPTCALVTLALPRQFEAASIAAIYEGLCSLARQYGVAIVGGETTTNPAGMLISISMIGLVAKDKCVLRTGAQAGDAVFVTGDLGGSLAGKHLKFEPRVNEALWLTDHFAIHSMLDLSDGLAGDLPHLLKANDAGAELLAKAIPVSAAARRRAKASAGAKSPLLAALTDGEDFELLFTVGARDAVPLIDAWKQAFPAVRLSCIGKVTKTPGLHLRTEHAIEPLTAQGYVHFAGN
jgi:thiamine-monophosphate kinase